MKFHLKEIIDKLIGYKNKISIINENESFINSVCFFDCKESNFNNDTLYIGTNFRLNSESESILPQNLISIETTNTLESEKLLNDISKILYHIQKINTDIVTLTEALYSGDGLQNLVDVASDLLGNPFFIRDSSFKIHAFTSNVVIEDDIWNEITLKGYQDLHHYQYLMESGVLYRASQHKIPILHQFAINESDIYGVEFIKKDIFNEDYVVSLEKGSTEKKIHPRIWSRISHLNKPLGYMVIVEAYKKFTDYDIALIKKISEILALELKNSNIPDNTTIQKQNSVLVELLEGKINDLDNLKSKIKIAELVFYKNLKIVALKTKQKNAEELPLNYIKGFFVNSFSNVSTVFYDGYFVAIISSDKKLLINENQLNKIKSFSQDIKMSCGISRNFASLLNIKSNFQLAVEAIEAGQKISPENYVFHYENIIMQHIISICEKDSSLKNFCLPNLKALKEYDAAKGTDLFETLHSYAYKFNNPTELAKKLNLHRNTLYYRIKKIEDILNIDLSNADNLFRVYFSFKILEYLGVESDIFNLDI